MITAPPSPNPPRFFEGKKLKVAASPSAPAIRPSSLAPWAWAASSRTLIPRGAASSISSLTGAGFPNRWTGSSALVRSVITGSAVAAVMHQVSLVDVAEHRGRADRHHRLGGGEEA